MNILIICTGNTCRSQMAEGILKSLDKDLSVFSAGTRSETNVNPLAIKVMKEIGIDISTHYPKPVDLFLEQAFDFVITVCDGAREVCPVFTGTVSTRLHIGFEDPAAARGAEEEVLPFYRKIRDEIMESFTEFYNSNVKPL